MQIRLFLRRFVLLGSVLCWLAGPVSASVVYTYKPNEYVTVVHGESPDGKYAVASHGGDPLGYDHFHLYLMDARTHQKIGPLEEAAKDPTDTGAKAYEAKWSADSTEVGITYRGSRHVTVVIRYKIGQGRATLLSGPTPVPE